jgi:hypothetical protein
MAKYKLGDWREYPPENMRNEERERRMAIEFGPVIKIERYDMLTILCSDGTSMTAHASSFRGTRRRHEAKLVYLTFTKYPR